MRDRLLRLHIGQRLLLVDCVSFWLANLMFAERDLDAATEQLVLAVAKAAGPLIFVSNEVGSGIVPDNALARQFRDAAGIMNQMIAQAANEVEFVVAGLPVRVK